MNLMKINKSMALQLEPKHQFTCVCIRLETKKSYAFFFFFMWDFFCFNGPKVWCFYFLVNADYLPKSQSCYWLWLLLKEGGTGADGKMTTEIPTQIWAWVSGAQVAIWTSNILTGCHGDSSLQCQKGPEKSPASEARTRFLYLRFSSGRLPSVCNQIWPFTFYRFIFKQDAATFLYIICLNKATVSDSFYVNHADLFHLYKSLLVVTLKFCNIKYLTWTIFNFN